MRSGSRNTSAHSARSVTRRSRRRASELSPWPGFSSVSPSVSPNSRNRQLPQSTRPARSPLATRKTVATDDPGAFEILTRLLAACESLPARERLDAIGATWLCVAYQDRSHALPFGAFEETKARQLAELQTIRRLVDAATPNLEVERLVIE